MYESKKVYISPFYNEFKLPTIEQVIALKAKADDKVYIVGCSIDENGTAFFKDLNQAPFLFNSEGYAVNSDTILQELARYGVSLDTPVNHCSSVPYNDWYCLTLYIDLD